MREHRELLEKTIDAVVESFTHDDLVSFVRSRLEIDFMDDAEELCESALAFNVATEQEISLLAQGVVAMASRLSEILDTMDIPESNKDLSRPRNTRWLLRNIRVNNKGHKDLTEAVEILKQINKLRR